MTKITTFPPQVFSLMGQREYQQDSCYPVNDETNPNFFIVCDGVGGSERGELASQTVTAEMAAVLDNVDWDLPFTPEHLGEALAMVYKALDSKASGIDTATTLTLLCFHAGGCLMAHIGDSRIYQFRPDEGIIFRTEDHSLVNRMVKSGKISPQEALTHPDRNVITRCMQPCDGKPHDRATVRTTNNVRKGDIFLLCSDGVTDEIDDDTLCDIILSDDSFDEKTDHLATLCEDASDNATAILIEVSEVCTDDEEIFDNTEEVSPEGEDVYEMSFWTRIKQIFKSNS